MHVKAFLLLHILVCGNYYSMTMVDGFSTFVTRYFDRLRLDKSNFITDDPEKSPTNTLQNLQAIQEAHLLHVPFENLAQHGAVGGPATLDLDVTTDKILDRQRGGFCFEINGLLSKLLTELGYELVIVPATVYTPQGYRGEPTHIILLVTCADKCQYMVDAGFGEPSIHPLKYRDESNFCFDQTQVTAEGMHSKFTKDNDSDIVELKWLKDNEWQPRLRWSFADSTVSVSPKLAYFGTNLQHVLHNDSIFAQKLICTRLSREEKVTIAGNRLKITTPRFAKDGSIPKDNVKITVLDSEDAVRQKLQELFAIPSSQSKGLDLSRSISVPVEIWDNQ